jgi:hypothetical protein
MPYGDAQWISRNPELFSAVGGEPDRACACGETLVRAAEFWATQDHPWRPPRVLCDCGVIHRIVGLRRTREPETRGT